MTEVFADAVRTTTLPVRLADCGGSQRTAVHTIRVQARINGQGAVELGALGVGDWEARVAGQVLRFRLTVSAERAFMPPRLTRR